MNILLSAVLLLLLSDAVSAQCPTTGGWEDVAGQCMVCRDSLVGFHEAEVYCLQQGAHLTSIHNSQQQKYVEDCKRIIAPDGGDIYVGMVFGSIDGDEPASGAIAWMDGTPYDYPIEFLTTSVPDICVKMKMKNNQRKLKLGRNCHQEHTFVCSVAYLTCPSLGQIANADITYSNETTNNAYVVSTVATYKCREGYSLSGDATRTCQAANTWSTPVTPPSCTPVNCGSLDSPDNGEVIAQTTTLASVALYTCDQGYNVSGDVTRTCASNGQWGGNVEATCVAVDSDADSNDPGPAVVAGAAAGGAVGLLALGGILWALCRPTPPVSPQLPGAFPTGFRPSIGFPRGPRPPIGFPRRPGPNFQRGFGGF